MKPKIKVVIIEDNAMICQLLNELLKKYEDIEIVETCTNGEDGIKSIEKNNPDVVILDIIMPECDGFTVIKTEKAKHPNCKFIVISSLNQDTFVTKALESGASYYIMKPFKDLDLIERIYDVCKTQDNLNNKTKMDSSDEDTVSKSLNIKLSNILISVGIPANTRGYYYLRSAIIMVLQHPDYSRSITKSLYPIVAKEYNTTPSRVERSIRHAIEIAWNRGKIGNINGVFGVELFDKYDKPTNSELIALLADKLFLESA